MEELLSTWQREARAALGVREKGMNLELFKVVFMRTVEIQHAAGKYKI